MVFSPDKLPGIMDAWTNLWKQGRNDIFCTVAIAALNPDNKVPSYYPPPYYPLFALHESLRTLYTLCQGFLVLSGSASKGLSPVGIHISVCRRETLAYRQLRLQGPSLCHPPRKHQVPGEPHISPLSNCGNLGTTCDRSRVCKT